MVSKTSLSASLQMHKKPKMLSKVHAKNVKWLSLCKYQQKIQALSKRYVKDVIQKSMCEYYQQNNKIFSKTVCKNYNPEKQVQTLSIITKNNIKRSWQNCKQGKHLQVLLSEIKSWRKQRTKNGSYKGLASTVTNL